MENNPKNKEVISFFEFEFIYKVYNPTCRVIPEKGSMSYKRTAKAVKALGSVDLLRNTIEDYLKHIEQSTWRSKKGFDAFMNSPEHYGKDWAAENEEVPL